jgi:hypothetical protein
MLAHQSVATPSNFARHYICFMDPVYKSLDFHTQISALTAAAAIMASQ